MAIALAQMSLGSLGIRFFDQRPVGFKPFTRNEKLGEPVVTLGEIGVDFEGRLVVSDRLVVFRRVGENAG